MDIQCYTSKGHLVYCRAYVFILEMMRLAEDTGVPAFIQIGLLVVPSLAVAPVPGAKTDPPTPKAAGWDVDFQVPAIFSRSLAPPKD